MKTSKTTPPEILILLGSPREDGNSSRLAYSFADAASARGAHVQAIRLSELNIALSSGEPSQRKGISAEDDMTSLHPLLLKADILVFATPLYFATWSAALKLFWDRLSFYSPMRNPKLVGKSCVLLATAGNPDPTAFNGLRETYRLATEHMQWKPLGEIRVGGVSEPDDIGKTDKWFKKAYALAAKIVPAASALPKTRRKK